MSGDRQASLFVGSAAPRIATREMKRDALVREIAKRRHVYPRLVNEGKMRKSEADYEVWILEQILVKGFQP